jgi:DNA-binding IclR family transcriptional regulator
MTTESVRSLQRGLAVLEYFNIWNRATVSEVTSAFSLPRGTAYRLLETLHRCGYLEKGHERGQYLIAPKVVELSCAFESETWIAQTAHPLLDRAAEAIGWPVLLAIRVGADVCVKARSEPQTSPFRREIPVGSRLGLKDNAAGLAALAFSDDASEGAGIDPSILEDIRQEGYASVREARTAIIQVAVPIMVDGAAVGALMARYDDRAPTGADTAEQLAAVLAEHAHTVGDTMPKDYCRLLAVAH